MSETPALAVIVPFYDSDAYIRDCLESLQAQQGVRGSVELIFIDNGSSDRSPEIVSEFSGVTRLREETPGAYAARNAGIRKATAPILAFTDADCCVDPNWLSTIQEAMESPEVGILIGHCRYPEHASTPLHLLSVYENAKASYVTDRCEPEQRFAYGNNMAVRASVFEELGPFEEWKRAADSELVHRLAARLPAKKLRFEKAMRVTHLEFVRAKARAKRLRLYSQTNTQIGTFKELTLTQRVGIMLRALGL